MFMLIFALCLLSLLVGILAHVMGAVGYSFMSGVLLGLIYSASAGVFIWMYLIHRTYKGHNNE